MRIFFLISVLFYIAPVTQAQSTYWQQRVDNTIRVKLNDKDHTLDGFITISYTNNSPDTLSYIWFHLWPNAYKNDRTAFSEQSLENGRTDFYFSSPEQKGYINQLDFRINDTRAELEDDPVHQDMVKVILPSPLSPQQTITITTPFHVKLPDNFSRGGHAGQSYQITQWYPKPAVYDAKGWHAMPYLDQGEFYSEFGNFKVTITLPENYVVAATGELQNESEKTWLHTRSSYTWKEITQRKKLKGGTYKKIRQAFPVSAVNNKTLQYILEDAHDFAWFADKRFVVNIDTCMLASGNTTTLYSFHIPDAGPQWNDAITYTKKALRFYTNALGEYPYPTFSVVQGPISMQGGMEYPSLALIANMRNNRLTEQVIAHEAGHSWLYGILGSNERIHPWMDEGMTSFYDARYMKQYMSNGSKDNNKMFVPENAIKVLLETVISAKKDQPINIPAPDYNAINYALLAYTKAAEWMQLVEGKIGQQVFDTAMRKYYQQWKFRHPYPSDFKQILSASSGQNMDSLFSLLSLKGSLIPSSKKKLRFAWLGKMDIDKKYNYIGVAPAVGFNYYDKFMLGGIIHNYNLPFTKFQFVAVPLYASGSKQLNAIGRLSYSWYPQTTFQKVEAGISGESFTADDYTDSANHTTKLRFIKVAPYLRFTLQNNNPRSQLSRYLQLKYYFISEDDLRFSWDSVRMTTSYSVFNSNRGIAQLRYVTENARALYPYNWNLQFDAGKGFGRVALTGNYFFNYAHKGGLNVRGFAGKFFYVGAKTSSKRSDTYRYHLNMTAPKGDEDYTYSNYFLGRNEFEGFLSQQVMMRDGGFKVRTDLLSSKTGRTDNWLLALNLTSSLHPKIPVKVFADMGTFSDAWEEGSDQPRVLFDGGLQVSLFKDIVNIYVPLFYSKVYSDYFKSTPGNNFWQRISFSIDIQQISFKKLHPLIPF